MTDSYVQVATDGSGKKVAMEQVTDAYGNTVYLQKALLVGVPADMIEQILELNRQQLAVLRAMLRIMSETTNVRTTEEDYSAQKGASFDV